MTGPGSGYVRAVRGAGGGTSLTHVRATSPLRLFTPRVSDRDAWVVTSTLGGGLVGGDDIRLQVDVDAGARLWITTQASTKVYRTPRPTRQTVDASVGAGALLVSWPDPLVVFDEAIFEQCQRYRLDAGATLVAVDCVLSGRHARGERWAFDRYLSRIEIERDGRPIFLDAIALDARDGRLAERMGRFHAYALCVMTGPAVSPAAARWLETIAASPVDRDEDVVRSAAPLSRDPDAGVVVRLAATDPERLAAALAEIVPVTAAPLREPAESVKNYAGQSCT